METEVQGIQTRCFSKCFAAINEMKIVIVTIQFSTAENHFPPFTLAGGEGRGRIDTRNPCPIFHDGRLAIFLRLLPLFRTMFEPVLEKLRDDTIAVIRGEFHGQWLTGTRPDNYLPRIPWI